MVVLIAASVAQQGSAATAGAYQRMVAKLHSLKTYKATIHGKLTLQPANGRGAANTITSVETVLYKSPNKLSIKAQQMMGGLLIVSNGKTIYQYSGLANQYTANPAPANLLGTIIANAGSAHSFKQVGTTQIDGVSVAELKGTSSTPQGT
ncbi:MAG TPA: DUF2092 domain-containing protein, partial [Capsulimonadaceae bacterium]|nr:DUF2092 domain-containing protein [Capsulimonadaceae bacterium]